MTMLLLLANAGTLRAGWRMVERARGARHIAVREIMLRPGRIAPRHAPSEIDESCAICSASATKREDGSLVWDYWTRIHCALCRLSQGQAGLARASVFEVADDDGIA